MRRTGRAGRILGAATGLSHERHRARVTTMASLLRSLVSAVILGMGNSAMDIAVRAAPLTTSIGLNAWTCMSGTRRFTSAARSKVRRAVPSARCSVP